RGSGPPTAVLTPPSFTRTSISVATRVRVRHATRHPDRASSRRRSRRAPGRRRRRRRRRRRTPAPSLWSHILFRGGSGDNCGGGIVLVLVLSGRRAAHQLRANDDEKRNQPGLHRTSCAALCVGEKSGGLGSTNRAPPKQLKF